MGYEAAIAAVVAAVATAATSYMSQSAQAEAQKQQMAYQSAVNRQNAAYMQNQAELERQKGNIVQDNLNREQEEIRETFEYQQGNNINLLAAGNVDITSGSAAAALEGNINRFADDIAWNEYQKDIANWEAEEKANYYEYQADTLLNDASYMQSTASNLGPSLLQAGISGASTGLSVYGAAGGTFGSSTASASSLKKVPTGATNPTTIVNTYRG